MMAEIGLLHRRRELLPAPDGRGPGEPPPTLIEYLPTDALVFLDESHMTVPQLNGHVPGGPRAQGDPRRLRLPSPLRARQPASQVRGVRRAFNQLIYVSATPAAYELGRAEGLIAEQVIRPTGLMDPEVEVRPARGPGGRPARRDPDGGRRGQRVLVTTLTKRMAEDLTKYYKELGVRVKYLHSDIHTLERVEIIRDLRMGEFDCLVGVNLLREGSTSRRSPSSAILDADKEGFLRSARSLIQTIGRAARNVDGA